MILLKDHNAETLQEALADLRPPERLVRQLHALAMKHSALEIPAELPNFSKRLLAQIRERVSIPALTLVDKVVSPRDGFAKYIFTGADERRFEAVRIPLLHRPGDEKYIVCVSSQVGCALECAFCATGRGFPTQSRHLGNCRSGGADPAGFRVSGAGSGLHGHGRADAQLRPCHPRCKDFL